MKRGTKSDSGGYSTNIWISVSRWGFETLTLFRTKQILNTYTVWDNSLNFITPFRTNDKVHAVLFLSHLLAIAMEPIHVIVWVQTNFMLFIIRTDSHKILYPLKDSEVKKPALSCGTTLNRPYKGVPPGHDLTPRRCNVQPPPEPPESLLAGWSSYCFQPLGE